MAELNVGAVVRRVVDLLSDVRFLGHAAGRWLAILLAANLAVFFVQPGVGEESASFGWLDLLKFVRGCAEVLAETACAVNVHRFVLSNEAPTPLRVSRIEWRYILRGLRVWLPAVAVIVVVVALASIANLNNFLSSAYGHAALAVAMLLVVVPLLMPRSLSLPALAIGRREFAPADGGRAAMGNRRAIYLCTLIVGTIPSLALLAIDRALLTFASTIDLLGAIYAVVTSLITIFRAMLWASLLSFLYAGLVEQRREVLR